VALLDLSLKEEVVAQWLTCFADRFNSFAK
jgi:hypothetical protein